MTENEKLLLVAAGAFLLLAAGATTGVLMSQPRGIRNNNPGNLKEPPTDTTRWVGERATNDDPIFEEFATAEYGIRALALTLLNYSRWYGLNTVEKIIGRFAPASENDTAGYAAFVARLLGVGISTPINVDNVLPELVKAIIQFENGQQPYSSATVSAGVQMARQA